MSTFSFKFSKLNKSKYCVCTTAADVAEKIVSITDSIFALNAGVIVNVLFQNANTADSPTLNVNSTGAKNIFHRGYQITSGTNKNELKDVVQFIYDGTNWRIIGNLVNTSNTTGASATSGTKMYPVAAFGQYGAAQTFTNSNVYIGADNELYSNNKKVATQTDITTLSNKIGSVGNTDLQTQVTSLNSNMKPKNDFAIVEGYVQAGGGNTIVPYPTGYGQYTCCVIATYSDLFGTRYNSESTCYTSLESNGVNLHLPGGGSGTGLVRAVLMKT